MIKSKLEVERLETIRKVIPDRYNVARNEGNGSSKSNAQETVKISRVEGYECLSRKRVKGLKIRCGTLFFMRQSNKIGIHKKEGIEKITSGFSLSLGAGMYLFYFAHVLHSACLFSTHFFFHNLVLVLSCLLIERMNR
jgi:hypothetical protein